MSSAFSFSNFSPLFLVSLALGGTCSNVSASSFFDEYASSPASAQDQKSPRSQQSGDQLSSSPVAAAAGKDPAPEGVVQNDGAAEDISSLAFSNPASSLLQTREVSTGVLKAAPPLPPAVDWVSKNARTTMRLSIQNEADLGTAWPSTAQFIRFFFASDPNTSLGFLRKDQLVISPRIGISDNVPIPEKSFQIAYDFRDARGVLCGQYYWHCDSIKHPTGFLEVTGTFTHPPKAEGEKGYLVRNKIAAVRLRAIRGGGAADQPPIRVGLIDARYSEGAPIIKLIDAIGVSPSDTFMNDQALMEAALATYKKPVPKVKPDAPIIQGASCYSPLRDEELTAAKASAEAAQELDDYAVALAGEYIRLAQQKYNQIVSPDNTEALMALLRHNGVVTRLTAKTLLEYLGLA